MFAVFFATLLVERRKALGQFELARTTMRTGIGFTNTLVLLTSSLLLAVSEYVAPLGAGPGLRYCSWPSVPFGAS